MKRAGIIDRLATNSGQAARRIRSGTHRRMRGDRDIDPDFPVRAGPWTPAAVLVPLIERSRGFTVLLTQRAESLNEHAGQISFPGGRIEVDDLDAVDAALRETEEEIGLPRTLVTIVGRLDDYETGTGFIITPLVGFVTPPFQVRPDPLEVAEAFEVPLTYIMDPANHRRESSDFGGIRRHYYVLPYEGRSIWGATAGMLINLYEVLSD